MYSLVRAVLWRPLPYPEPDRIVTLRVDARDVTNAGATPGEAVDLKDRARSLHQVSMIDTGAGNLEWMGEPERIVQARVSDGVFPLLGARMALGRALDTRIYARPGGAAAIAISGEFWRERFAADEGVIGRNVRLNDVEVEIAGVVAPGFRLFLPPAVSEASEVDVWLPYSMDPVRRYRGTAVLARLRPGFSVEMANAELWALAAQFEREHPE
ncbi:MAG: ABC transporter permease [Bryobacteraceae bacterium]